MKRKIVSINENKCNGCGICVKACHEGAIEIVDGVAKLVSDEYCDGLGDCLPGCPMGAIEIIERESVPYDDDAVQIRKEKLQALKTQLPCGCPGTSSKRIERNNKINVISKVTSVKNEKVAIQNIAEKIVANEDNVSELRQWPVQLKLINPNAEYFKDANLLVAADCTAYAYGSFHKDFMKDCITVIGCPKLDDIEYYKEKLAAIIRNNNIKSITVVRMEVPCCRGIVEAVKNAMLEAQIIVPYKEVTISTEGNVI